MRYLINRYDHVYTDLAYHDEALKAETSKQYFSILEALLEKDARLRERLLFGTDWPMPRHTWTELDYVQSFKRLNAPMLGQIAFENSLDFLFPNRRFPVRISNFLRANNKDVDDLPGWLREVLDNV